MIKTIYKLAEESRTWKGDKAGYHGMHSWVRTKYGKPKECEMCGLKGKLEGKKRLRWNIEYALKPKATPSRNREDYICLCKSCHRKIDMTDDIKNNISKNRKGIRLGVPNLWKRKEFCVRGHKRELLKACAECNRIRSRDFYRNNYATKKQII